MSPATGFGLVSDFSRCSSTYEDRYILAHLCMLATSTRDDLCSMNNRACEQCRERTRQLLDLAFDSS